MRTIHGLAGILSVLLLGGCAGSDDGTTGGYVFEPVTRGVVAAAVTATGTVNPVNSVQVGTYVSGPILAIDVDYNSVVTRGQRVAKIDPATFVVKVQKAEASVGNARARVEKDRADLALKKLTLERSRELLADDLISANDVDTARSEHDQALAQLKLDEAAVRQAEADLEDARINLRFTDIRSPVDGVVVSRDVDVGQTVAATFQTPTLFLIAEDLTKMQVNASVSESDIGSVAPGQPVRFVVDAYRGREFSGSVVQVRNAPTTVQNVVTYDVIVDVDNHDLALKPGMTANVTIVTVERDDVLRVSPRALRFQPTGAATGGTAASAAGAPPAGATDRPGVWVRQPDGSLKRQEIEVGVRSEAFVEVTSDQLAEGAQIAVAMQRSDKRTPAAPSIPGMPRYR